MRHTSPRREVCFFIYPLPPIPSKAVTLQERKKKMERYAEVILPLALPGTFTYRLPEGLEGKVQEGSRVVVPFGKRKHYTAIVAGLHDNPPRDGMELKDISGTAGDAPLLLPRQLDFWKWLSYYYMCTPGEVMKAALPSGLKLESETVVTLNEDFDRAEELEGRERELLGLLPPGKGRSIEMLQKGLRAANLLPVVRGLLEKGAIAVQESLNRQFKPRTETHVRLRPEYRDERKLNRLLDALKRSEKQAEMLLAYLELSRAAAALALGNEGLLCEVPKKELLKRASGSEAALAALRSKGVLDTYPFEVGRIRTAKALPGELAKPLSEAQQAALDGILAAFKSHNVCLLHGVTSSGKTEVYTHLIRRELAAGRQVLYLLPEIALTTQITSRLGRAFGEQMGVYHSKFPDAERVELWQRQLSPKAFPLILGVRSSLFLPFRNLGLVIVDEEHEASYKQQDPAPRYNARDAAIMLARLYGAKVLLGTATPAIETYHNAMEGRYGLVEMNVRYGDVRLPEIHVEDTKELRRKKLMKTPFSPRLAEEIRCALENKEQVILFQNRRGYSPVLECRTCGWVPRCNCCDVSLTFHQKIGKLVCHYCGASYEIPKSCPNCEDSELRDVGYGTEKIEAAVHACFPEARTARMDLDTTRSRSAYEKIISDFQQGNTDLLIGTQMVTKGLDFDRVRVVGILNADQMLNQPDFRAHERAFQMMAQVAGRAGRRGRRGTVVLQTGQPEAPVVRQIVENDYRAMYGSQLAERELFRYPPCFRIIEIFLKHRHEAVCEAAAGCLAAMLRPHFGDNLLGPDRPAVGRIQLLYIRKMVLKVTPGLPASGVRNTLWAARAALLAQPRFKGVGTFFDVDPL